MTFYEEGAQGRRLRGRHPHALQAILASPHFIFRLEEAPAACAPGQNYRISDLDLASRLSFFLWGAPPDDELLKSRGAADAARAGVLEKQVRRMLADPRAEALATRFAAQWLRLQDLDKIHPDALLFPHFDDTLADAMRARPSCSSTASSARTAASSSC